MQPIYLLAICKPRNGGEVLTRIAKCTYVADSIQDEQKLGEWWRLEVFDNPLPAMLDLVFIGLDWDRGTTAARALDTRLGGGLGRCSSVQWECDCGPIDADDAVLVRVELAVLTVEGE
jgi:hypothetical protein